MTITKEQLEYYYLEEQLTATEIGEIFLCDRKNIDYYLKKYGIPKRTRKEANDLRKKRKGLPTSLADIEKHLEEGWLLQDIAEHYGVSRRYLYNITKKEGVNLRNHENFRKMQSEFMQENNPVPKGSTRPLEHKRGLLVYKKTRIEEAKLYYETVHMLDFKEYQRVAQYLAYKHYGKGADIPEGYEIDHKYSIKDGYYHGVPAPIISHPFNIRLVTIEENRRKGTNSIITLSELYEGVR